VDGEDLLDHDPRIGPGDLAKPAKVSHRVGQPVGMVHPHAVDEAFGEPPTHLHVAGVEHGAVLLAQTRQRRYREKPSVAAQSATPADQAIMLAVVYLGSRARTRAGCDRERQISEP